jgi:four helix bundle protein
MTEDELKSRTKNFALKIISFANLLLNSPQGKVLGNQLLRSGTSVGANYRSACNARSKADFISKISISQEEADESAYWMELIIESKLIINQEAKYLLKESKELSAILTASIKTAKCNKNINSKYKI